MIGDKQLNKNSPIPLYFQLKTLITGEIRGDEYKVDTPIPTEKELAQMFDISRTTVRQAITELVQEGWLYRKKSKGTFVARLKLKQDFIKRLERFDDQISRTGCTPSTKVITFAVVNITDHQAEKLNLPLKQKWIYLHRCRYADQDPIVTVETYLPYDQCSFLFDHDFEKESLYDVLSERAHTKICRVTRILEAVAATGKDMEYLCLAKGKPIHSINSIGYNDKDEPIEFSFARYRGDRNRFEVDVLPG